MSLPVKASKTFLRKSIPGRITAGDTISTSLKENAGTFKNLPFDGETLGNKNAELSKALTTAQSGDRKAASDLKVIDAEWKEMFSKTADAVSLEAEGSEVIILKAGMKATSSSRKKSVNPEQPANTEARPGKGKGTASVSVNSQEGVNGYVGVLTPLNQKMRMVGDTLEIETSDGTIYIQACSRSSVNFAGLPSYTPFCATVFTFNSAGTSPLSNSGEMATQ